MDIMENKEEMDTGFVTKRTWSYITDKVKLPKCTGYKNCTDWGHEFDCDAIHGQSCEDCLCTYKSLGGLWHPETGKKIHPVMARLRYGAKNTEQLLQPNLQTSKQLLQPNLQTNKQRNKKWLT